MLLYTHSLCTIRQNLGCNIFALLRSLTALASAKICYALPPLQATIVLPDFGRSLSADGNRKHLSLSLFSLSLRGTIRQLADLPVQSPSCHCEERSNL
jgi:hypothetical protein